MTTPICRQCGKKLIARTTVLFFQQSDGVRTEAEAIRRAQCEPEAVHKFLWDDAVKVITPREANYSGYLLQTDAADKPTVQTTEKLGYKIVVRIVWKTGSYGYRGQGIFCTLGCGYHYGVRCWKAQDLERRQRESAEASQREDREFSERHVDV